MQPRQTPIGCVSSLDSTPSPPPSSPNTRTVALTRMESYAATSPETSSGTSSTNMMPHPGPFAEGGGTKAVADRRELLQHFPGFIGDANGVRPQRGASHVIRQAVSDQQRSDVRL